MSKCIICGKPIKGQVSGLNSEIGPECIKAIKKLIEKHENNCNDDKKPIKKPN